jgi:hypothetical protein
MNWQEHLQQAARNVHDPRTASTARGRGQKWLHIKRELNLPPEMTYEEWCAKCARAPERTQC